MILIDDESRCASCKHNDEPWYSDACDPCCSAHSNYEPKESEDKERCGIMGNPIFMVVSLCSLWGLMLIVWIIDEVIQWIKHKWFRR